MHAAESNKIDKNLSDEILYKIEVAANRYDLLCLEGLAQSLRVFLGLDTPPNYKVITPKEPVKFYVEKSVENVRPFACSAILRDITFTESSLKSFIDLQDKLHQNICRQRTLVTMGTHDLDSFKGPVYFRAEEPEKIVFKALKQEKETDGKELLEILKQDNKLKKYVYMLEGAEVFPILRDAENKVLALPPLINSEYSKISVNTKNVLIDITAHDETKANIVLNILVTMFSTYCKDRFTVEGVEVIDYKGNSKIYPKLEFNTFKVDIPYLNRISGTNTLQADTIIELLDKMSLKCLKKKDNNDLKETELLVTVPPTRSDIIHACDIAEDLAIAYGYDNVQKIKLTTVCNGYQQPLNKLSEIFRQEMAMSGYTEALTFSLLSKEDCITKMGYKIEDKLGEFIQIGKSKTQELEVLRNSLIPGILKTIEANQMSPLPIKLFELSDVGFIDEKSETGAKNRRHLAFAYANNHSGFEIVQGVLDHLFESKLGLTFQINNKEITEGYTIKPSVDNRFFPDRQAEVFVLGQKIGIFGVLNPKINTVFGKLPFPITICEIDIEHVFELIKNNQI